MKRITTTILIMAFIATGAPALAALTAAERTVADYLAASKQGNVKAVESMICGPLLKKRARLLSNPDYSAHLIEAYRNTRFGQPRETGGRQGEQATVEVSITFPGGEKVIRRYSLMKKGAYCIQAETGL